MARSALSGAVCCLVVVAAGCGGSQGYLGADCDPATAENNTTCRHAFLGTSWLGSCSAETRTCIERTSCPGPGENGPCATGYGCTQWLDGQSFCETTCLTAALAHDTACAAGYRCDPTSGRCTKVERCTRYGDSGFWQAQECNGVSCQANSNTCGSPRVCSSDSECGDYACSCTTYRCGNNRCDECVRRACLFSCGRDSDCAKDRTCAIATGECRPLFQQ